MEQTDLILLCLAGLSVFVGLIRGISEEILRLVIYILSGVLGYASASVIQPFFSVIPQEVVQKSLAILAGTFVFWIVLRIIMSFFTRKIKESRFRKLDRYLGGIFGTVRAGAVLMIIGFALGIFMPHIVQSSKILTLSSKGNAYLFSHFPELEKFNPQKTEIVADLQKFDWKKRLLHYLQNQTINTKDGEKTLISVLSSQAVKGNSMVIVEQNYSSEKEKEEFSLEQKEEIAAELFEAELISLLSGQPVDEEELKNKLQDKRKKWYKESHL